MKRSIRAVLVVLCGILGMLVCGSKAFAVSSNSSIMEKWFLTEYISQCKGEVETPISQDKINSIKNTYVKNSIFKGTKKLQLPSYNYSGVNSKKTINCREMFLGDSKSNGLGLLALSKLKNYNDLTWSGDSGKVSSFMKSMGYKSDGSGTQTIQIKYKYSSFVLKQEDVLKATGDSIQYKNGQYSKVSSNVYDFFSINVDNNNKKIVFKLGPTAGSGCKEGGALNSGGIEIPIGSTPEETARNIENKLSGLTCTISSQKYQFQSGCAELSGGGGWKYDVNYTAKSAAKSIGGFNGTNDVYWTKSERYNVYMHYLNSAATEITCDLSSPSSVYKKVQLKDGSGKMNKNCYVSFNGLEPNAFPVAIQSTKKLEIIGDSNNKKSSVTLQNVISWLNNTEFDKEDVSEMLSVGELAKNDSEDDENNPAPKTCENQGGAQSLGWIVCPILNWLGKASTEAYENYVEPSLRVDPQLFTRGNEGVRTGWENFRNIANVIFIILLLAVIFSQLTGVGIDNYGIKKILPKLIVAAILINLSYLICILMVDLSNILGNGLRMMFDGLPVSGGTAESLVKSINGVEGIEGASAGSGTLVTVGVLALLVAMVGVVWQNPAILLSLLVAALGVAISIFFLFVLLAVREAGVIVAVVISPLAVAAYMLPNTKKLFDKWLKLFQGLLLVYPICGLLVGGGNYISKLLLSAEFAGGGFLKAFTAMVVGIVPIFFIPTVLKSSFSAMGKVGGMLSGLGDRARKGATSGARNSQGYKTAQEAGVRRRTRIRAGINRDGSAKDLTAVGRLMRGGKRNVARNRAQYLKDQDTLNRADSLMGVGYGAAQIGQKKKADKEMTDNYATLINDKTRNGEDTNALYGMYQEYLDKGDKYGATAVARIAGRRKDTADAFMKEYIKNQNFANYTEKQKEAFSSVAKEIATGDNSGNFRTASPFAFQFMSDYNKDPDHAKTSYNDWTNDNDNISNALNNYVTNSQELVGMKGSSLNELNDMITSGKVKSADVDRIRRLAGETIDNRDKTGVWDSTKEKQIYALAGREGELNRGQAENDRMHDAWREQQGDFPIDHNEGGDSRIGGMYGGYQQ